MKPILTASLVLAAAWLAGCAPQPLTKADVDGKVVCNADRMAEVETKARRDHFDVHWVNCPRATLRAV